MTYEIAIKNEDKKEFDWNTNSSCIDFHLIIDGKSNYYYSGSYCDGSFEYYDDFHDNEEMLEYSLNEFKTIAEEHIKKFMKRKNKKCYETDELIEVVPIKMWNELEDCEDTVTLSLFLTYCP